jgi:hypothetical protein
MESMDQCCTHPKAACRLSAACASESPRLHPVTHILQRSLVNSEFTHSCRSIRAFPQYTRLFTRAAPERHPNAQLSRAHRTLAWIWNSCGVSRSGLESQPLARGRTCTSSVFFFFFFVVVVVLFCVSVFIIIITDFSIENTDYSNKKTCQNL